MELIPKKLGGTQPSYGKGTQEKAARASSVCVPFGSRRDDETMIKLFPGALANGLSQAERGRVHARVPPDMRRVFQKIP